MIVLDSSAAVEYLVGLEHGEWVAERLAGDEDVHAPHLLDIEVVAALRRLVTIGDVSRVQARRALDDLAVFDLTRYGHLPLLERMWELRANITAGDAAFVALTEALRARLVTTDRHLARTPGLRVQFACP